MSIEVRRGAVHARGWRLLAAACLVSAVAASSALAAGLTPTQLNQMRSVREVAVSPNGSLVAYVLEVPRRAGVDDDGPARRELHVVDTESRKSRPFITGDVSVSSPVFTPDGRHILYSATRFGDEDGAVWAIPTDGGESRKVLSLKGMGSFHLSPDGESLALLVTPEKSEARLEAEKKGYDREIFEEDWRPMELHIVAMAPLDAVVADPEAEAPAEPEPRRIAVEGSLNQVEWSPDGSRLVVGVQPRNLVDDDYMERRVRVLDAATGNEMVRYANPGKLDTFAMAPGNAHVAMISAQDRSDPSPGRLMVGDETGELRDLMPGFEAHVRSFLWRDATTLVWVADEGSETTLGTVSLDGTVERLLRSKESLGVPVMHDLHRSLDGRLAFVGDSPSHPGEVFTWQVGARPNRLTDSNPWLSNVELAPQEVITWTASDGLELEGILIRPLDGRRKAPLLLMVHGGPESNDRNGWVSNYSRPGQVAAARGYAVLYPNYRGSTGRGVAFSKHGHADAAGKEFQDLVEAVDHLIATEVASDRVGITGGSYGGYATAWCSTFYTDKFKAGVMFVGISNKLSKGFTTDIPKEDIAVHTTFNPWTKWEFSLERSPLYYASQSKTPLLIAHGQADTRVHPSQSLQLYRAFKLQDKTVRYVRYPGEPHGNRRAASRDDYLHRLLRWMDHFVKEGRTELPPMELD